jgi:hypothetical protein
MYGKAHSRVTEMAAIEGLRELFDRVLEGEPVVNFPLEGELATRPGEHRYWTVSYFPVTAEDGTVQAITAASFEVTQQKKAELALIQSEKLAVVGRLASIAHEINNPLESVTNLLYLAKQATTLRISRAMSSQRARGAPRVRHCQPNPALSQTIEQPTRDDRRATHR